MPLTAFGSEEAGADCVTLANASLLPQCHMTRQILKRNLHVSRPPIAFSISGWTTSGGERVAHQVPFARHK